MKRIICLIIVLSVTFLYGCQIPTDKITEDETSVSSLNGGKEVMNPEGTINSEGITGGNTSGIDNNTLGGKDNGALGDVDTMGESERKEEDGKKEETMIAVTAYYRDSDNQLIPLTRDIYKEEGIAKAALKSMVGSDLNRNAIEPLGLYTVLPEGTEILGMNIKDGIATIDFNDRILDYQDEAAENSIVAGVVYCLTEFKTIDGVKILIEGMEKESLKYGTDISNTLGRDNVLINSDKVNLADKLKKVDVYLFKYINGKNEFILPVSMEYIGVSENQLPGEIIRMLSAKPSNERIYSQIPSGVEVLDSKIEESLLVLNLNKEIKNYGGTAREEGILKQILYSMKQIKGIDRIQILIEGKKDNLPEGTEISRELLLPTEINRH